jgi:hypothetical protein
LYGAKPAQKSDGEGLREETQRRRAGRTRREEFVEALLCELHLLQEPLHDATAVEAPAYKSGEHS